MCTGINFLPISEVTCCFNVWLPEPCMLKNKSTAPLLRKWIWGKKTLKNVFYVNRDNENAGCKFFLNMQVNCSEIFSLTWIQLLSNWEISLGLLTLVPFYLPFIYLFFDKWKHLKCICVIVYRNKLFTLTSYFRYIVAFTAFKICLFCSQNSC